MPIQHVVPLLAHRDKGREEKGREQERRYEKSYKVFGRQPVPKEAEESQAEPALLSPPFVTQLS